jgi:hypothetical protein
MAKWGRLGRATLLAIMLTAACVSAPPPAAVDAPIKPVLTVKYVAGLSDAPREYIELTVEEDGGLSTGLNSPPPPRCKRLPAKRVSEISALVRSEAVRNALAEHVIASSVPSLPVRVHVRPDPAVIISVEESISAFAPAAVPPAILELLSKVDSAFRDATCAVPPSAVGPHIHP